MNTITSNPSSVIISRMRDSGIAIELAVKFHSFMRKSNNNRKTRKAVRVVLQSIRNNYNAKH